MPRRPAALAASLVVLAALGLASCSTGRAPAAGAGPTPAPSPALTTTDRAGETATAAASPVPAVHQDCGALEDAAVRERLATGSLVDALAADPRLAGFHELVTGEVDPEVDLTGVLASGTSTLLAPVDAELEASAATRRYLLSYHVVPGEALTPEELVGLPPDVYGHETLQGMELPAFGEVDAPLLSEDSVPVLCGPVPTAEGALYVVEGMLRPAGDFVVPGDPTDPGLPPTGTGTPDR